MITSLRAMTKWVLRLLPPLREWFAEIDKLAGDARRWRIEQARSFAGSKTDQDAILDLLSYLTPRRAAGFDKVRLGRDGDGGYVLLNDFSDVSAALSFGIDTDCSWDTDIAARGIDVYQYDHTVEGPPIPNPRFQFFQKKIAAVISEQSETLGSALGEDPGGGSSHGDTEDRHRGCRMGCFRRSTSHRIGPTFSDRRRVSRIF